MKVVPISAVVRTPEIVPNSHLAQLPGTELFKKNKYRQHLLKFIQDSYGIKTKCCTYSA